MPSFKAHGFNQGGLDKQVAAQCTTITSQMKKFVNEAQATFDNGGGDVWLKPLDMLYNEQMSLDSLIQQKIEKKFQDGCCYMCVFFLGDGKC